MHQYNVEIFFLVKK